MMRELVVSESKLIKVFVATYGSRYYHKSLISAPVLLRATACDVITHRNPCKIHFLMASKAHGTNVRHTRATVTALLEFLYKWMLLHLVYTIATLVCEEVRR